MRCAGYSDQCGGVVKCADSFATACKSGTRLAAVAAVDEVMVPELPVSWTPVISRVEGDDFGPSITCNDGSADQNGVGLFEICGDITILHQCVAV